MSLVFVTMLFLVFDVLILVDDVMAGPILGLKFLDPWFRALFLRYFVGQNRGDHI